MKLFIVTILFFFFFKPTLSQTGTRFAADNCRWTQYAGYWWIAGPGGPSYHQGGSWSHVSRGDTVINGKLLQKYYNAGDKNVDTICGPLVFYLYCDSNKVYSSPATEPDSLTLVYDFNLTIGDSFLFRANYYGLLPPVDTFYSVKVDTVGYSNWNGVNHKWIKFKTFGNLYYPVIWEEGIGDKTYGFYANDYRYATNMRFFGGDAYLECFADSTHNIKGTCVYTTNPCNSATLVEESVVCSFAIYPNPVNDQMVIDLGSHSEKGTVIIYNLMGQEMIIKEVQGTETLISAEKLPNGHYFCRMLNNNKVSIRKFIVEK